MGATVQSQDVGGPPARSAAGRATILLADDEAMLRTLGRAVLERQGYRVLLVEDGAEALEVYQRNHEHIDLVVLDQTMPRLSGREALARLRDIDPGVPILLSSGYSAPDLGTDVALQVEGFLAKPYRSDALVQAVRDALEQAEKRNRPRVEHAAGGMATALGGHVK